MKNNLLSGIIDVSTRRKRRAALSQAITLLEKIHSAEEAYLDHVPFNFRDSDAYEATEEIVDILGDAISTLLSVYD